MRILHISDIHFGRRTGEGKGGKRVRIKTSMHRWTNNQGTSDPRALAEIINNDEMLCKHPADIIIISGDIGSTGDANDYLCALDFLRSLKSKAQIVIAPGNHDVDLLRKSAGLHQRQDAFIRFLREFYGNTYRERYPIFNERNRLLKRHSIVSFCLVPKEAIVVAVNSAAAISSTDGPIYVDQDILQLIENQLKTISADTKLLRIFVLHHHLLPFAEHPWNQGNPVTIGKVFEKADKDIVANSAKVQTWLADNRFNLVLHGHKHISHHREDTLRREDDPEASKVVIIGAGSAGAGDSSRGHNEPLSYGIIDTLRLSNNRWSVRTVVRKISEHRTRPKALTFYHIPDCEIGAIPSTVPAFFYAEKMNDCHAAIKARTAPKPSSSKKEVFRNFVSIVDDHTYVFPGKTISIGGRVPDEKEVKRSFDTLHPEYIEDSAWGNKSEVNKKLKQADPRFQFHHGPRLFGVHGRAGTPIRNIADPESFQPIRYALKSLDGNSIAKAYVGLYNPEIDVGAEDEPLPGLMSVQFIPDGDYLDVVATFRKIELSFWWVVNMFEVGELLRWAAKQGTRKFIPRRVTFFAAIAEWKKDPEPAFVTELDKIELSKLSRLVYKYNEDKKARRELARLLDEKSIRTNEANIDTTGIDTLIDLFGEDSETSNRADKPPSVRHFLVSSRKEMDNARRDPDVREKSIRRAKELINEAVTLIRRH